MADPLRGEIWLADMGATRGHEQSGRRPVLILSADDFNTGPADLVIVLPLTSTIRNIPTHVVIDPPEGGLKRPSAVLCEAIRPSRGVASSTAGEAFRVQVLPMQKTLSVYC